MNLRIGVDVGGTCTDAVLVAGKLPPVVLAKAKVLTTPDVLTGIAAALQQLSAQHSQQYSQQYTQQDAGATPQLPSPAHPAGGLSQVKGVFVGTTQFVNAVVQRQQLARVFVVRLCGTATRALPPFVGIPGELQAAVAAGYLMAGGGYEFDGATEISSVSDADVSQAAEMVLQQQAQAVVVAGVHSPLKPTQELAFAERLKQHLAKVAPGVLVVVARGADAIHRHA